MRPEPPEADMRPEPPEADVPPQPPEADVPPQPPEADVPAQPSEADVPPQPPEPDGTRRPAGPMRPDRAVLRFWRYLYGENPLHLLAMVGCFALVGYAVSFVFPGPSALALGIWFVGAVLIHDLVLYPLYAFADQPLTITRWARRRVLPRRPPLVPAINHVRVPVLGSAVLGLIYFPTITQRGDAAFAFTSGHAMVGQYGNWLLITGVLFLGSAVIYALRLGVAAGRRVGALRAREPEVSS